MLRFKTLSAIVVLVALLSIGGTIGWAEQEQPQYGGTIVLQESQDFVGLNPLQETDYYSRGGMRQIFDSLLELSPETRLPAALLAEKWEFNKDGSEITFYLHHGVKFHNGQELTSEDVKFSIEWILAPNHATKRKPDLDWIDHVQVIDEYTFKIVVKPESVPNAAALTTLATLRISVVPKDFAGMTLEAFNEHPIGSGPFEFKEWVRGDHLTLVKNTDYWLKEPYLDQVIFRAIPKLATAMLELEKGGVDITDNVLSDYIPQYKEREDIVIQQVPAEDFYWIGFNVIRAPFNNITFRKAVSMSIDMDGAQQVIKGNASVRAYGIVSPTVWGNDREYLKNNVALKKDDEKAKQLFQELKDAGVIPPDFSPIVYTPPDPVRIKLGEILVTNLQQNGINAELRTLEWATYVGLLYGEERNYNIYVIGYPGFPEPSYLLEHLFASKNAEPGFTNWCYYKNPAVDLLLDTAARTLDHNLRESYYVAAQRLILEDYVVIPAYHNLVTRGVRARVHDYHAFTDYALVSPYNNVWVEPRK